MRIVSAAGIILLSACALFGIAWSDWKPTRNVDIVVASAAGGSSDRTARVVQKLLQFNPSFPSTSEYDVMRTILTDLGVVSPK